MRLFRTIGIASGGLNHQLVAGFVGVQSGGVSSGTTARGFMNQGAKRTYSAPRLDSACAQRAGYSRS